MNQTVDDFNMLPRLVGSREEALAGLVEGGIVLDLSPLVGNPHLADWIRAAPLESGRLTGDEIEQLPPIVQEAARQLLMQLGGTFDTDALRDATSRPVNGEPGALTLVSAEYLSLYWHSRGARVGKRIGNMICWFDSTQQSLDAFTRQEPQEEDQL